MTPVSLLSYTDQFTMFEKKKLVTEKVHLHSNSVLGNVSANSVYRAKMCQETTMQIQ